MNALTVGYRPPHELFDVADGRLAAALRRAEGGGIDRICVGDHVTFRDGRGFDGIVHATAVAMLTERAVVQTAVYLLALRHPVTVARQVASLAALAPGRFSFGVGAGGDDRAEVEACGVDPATRGRRTDESLAALRVLLDGGAVTSEGEFFALRGVRVLPTPAERVPVVVGGRSAPALRRAGALGDGWLGLWVTPERWAAAVASVEAAGAASGRVAVGWWHGLQVWCAFGASRADARAAVAAAMEDLYQLPFSRFERYVPVGRPADVAGALAPYVEAGCRNFNLIPVAPSVNESVDGVAEVRSLLVTGTGSAPESVI
ncbi:MAG TPA: LLM class flavin-dependent oxidoreductase [Acidimicrobiales bacterium]|nr:LLM class flavin-dependent oxidoreductase [Acidimicrobiales bacterium]